MSGGSIINPWFDNYVLDGEELTIMAFTDGRTVSAMLPAQDHKRVGDGDTGLNTGGMGAYSPAPVMDDATCERAMRELRLVGVSTSLPVALRAVRHPYFEQWWCAAGGWTFR